MLPRQRARSSRRASARAGDLKLSCGAVGGVEKAKILIGVKLEGERGMRGEVRK